jgi:hypothetical protein
MTPEMRDKLIARAGSKGRSITQEIELLLEQALLTERLLGGKAWRVGYAIISKFIEAAKLSHSGDNEPLDDPYDYMLGMQWAIEALADNFPQEAPPDHPREAVILAAIDVARDVVEKKLREGKQ